MKTLILYTTKHGTTTKCAEQLAKKFPGQVDVMKLSDNHPEMTGYDTVILGGSIYAGKIQKEMKAFCSSYIDTLKRKRLGLFLCCMSVDQAAAELKASFPDELFVHATATGRLGGGYKFSDMGFFEKMMIKGILKKEAKKAGKPTDTIGKSDTVEISDAEITRFAAAMIKG